MQLKILLKQVSPLSAILVRGMKAYSVASLKLDGTCILSNFSQQRGEKVIVTVNEEDDSAWDTLIEYASESFIFNVQEQQEVLDGIQFAAKDQISDNFAIVDSLGALTSKFYVGPEPQVGETYIHYKTQQSYVVRFLSEAGDKECNTRYVTYQPVAGGELYTRHIEDFSELMGYNLPRFALCPHKEAPSDNS